MIAFSDPAEQSLLAELRENGLVTPIVMEAVRRWLPGEEASNLMEFLFAGAAVIDERQWLTWLIRHHDCSRFGPVRLAPEGLAGTDAVPTRDLPLPPNLPWLRLADGRVVAAILRPDVSAPGYRAAATLRELRQLRQDWERAR